MSEITKAEADVIILLLERYNKRIASIGPMADGEEKAAIKHAQSLLRNLPATGAGGETPRMDAVLAEFPASHLRPMEMRERRILEQGRQLEGELYLSNGQADLFAKRAFEWCEHYRKLELALKSAEAAGMERAAKICEGWRDARTVKGANHYIDFTVMIEAIRAAAKGG